jgi:hypothetical protein
MDAYDSAGHEQVLDTPIPIPRNPPGYRRSGWLIGAICGVLASLWAFPAVRYTLSAQMEFALAEDNVPWISSLDAQRTALEGPRLDRVAARYSDDYLLQVGRATALATAGAGRVVSAPPARHRDGIESNDHTLVRLAMITRAFATTPGAYAHLARYLMADHVRIQRAELVSSGPVGAKQAPPPAQTIVPDVRNLKIMLWALRSGERLDSDNAFWPAMLATAYFAADEDGNALEALARAALKPRWDAYIYEEVLGQWRLYSAAYGDHGAAQQIGPLSLVVFPHLHEIRRMAEMARWHAERSAHLGKNIQAAQIRRNLAYLGLNLRDNAGWAFEALYGTDLFFIACTDVDSRVTPSAIRTVSEWEHQAVQYRNLLHSLRRDIEYRLMRSEVENSCELRKRVDLARYDSSYPGIPPGIPLMPLFGNWMAGVCLLQQALGLLVALAATGMLQYVVLQHNRQFSPRRTAVIVLGAVATLVVGALFLTMMTTPRMAGLFLIGVTLLSIVGLHRSWRWLSARRAASRPEGLHAVFQETVVRNSEEPAHVSGLKRVRERWSQGTTLRMLVLIVLPYLVILYAMRGELSALHPVATLLTSLTGAPRATGVRDSMELALLASALPLLLPLACAAWAFHRGVPPFAGAILGLRKLALPCLVCLVCAYAVLLNRTLILDAEASKAIQKAAQNDRQWVLTHGVENPF